jgi:hypothetical protein
VPDQFTNTLLDERADWLRKVEDVKNRAFDEKRDLVPTELEFVGRAQERVKVVDAQLKLVADDMSLNADTAAAIARYNPPGGAGGGDQQLWRSAGDCMWDFLHQSDDQSARDRIRQFHRRAAQHMGTTAETTVAVAGGFGGLLVSQTLGPIINLAPVGMPFVEALGFIDIATANTYLRPRIVDPDFTTAAGPQAGGKEKAELPSKKWDIVADPLAWAGVGNYINLSYQALTMVPAALDQTIQQLSDRTTYGIERTVVGVATGTSKVVPLAADADATAIMKAFGDAFVAVFKATKRPPSWLAMGPDGAGRLIGITDLAGRPLFPFLGPANAPGSNAGLDQAVPINPVAGLRTVLTPAIDDANFYMGNGIGIEAYVHRLPLLRATEPSVMGEQMAVAALVSTYQVPTTEAGPSNTPPAAYEGIVKIGA